MQATTIMLIGVVAVLVLIVLMALVVKIYREGDGLGGLLKVLPVFFVAIMAVIVLAQITEEITSYSYDESTGTLTITGNIYQDYSPWDDYAGDVRSLIIQDGATISAGAFDTLTNLTYVNIGNGVTLDNDVFGVTFQDPLGQTIEQIEGEYAGFGDGVLWASDPSLYTYSGNAITTVAPRSGSAIIKPTVKSIITPKRTKPLMLFRTSSARRTT